MFDRCFRYKSDHNQQGIYMVLFAIVVGTVFTGLLALVFGTGLIGSNYNKMQSVTDLATMAALDEFLNSEEEFELKKVAAIKRANAVFAQNNFPFLKDIVTVDSTDPESGKLVFGRWIRTAKDAMGEESCVTYPCFIDYSYDNTKLINAIRFKAKASFDNLFSIPGLKVLTESDEISLESQSTATVVQRCIAFMVDMSKSVAEETHWYEPHVEDENGLLTVWDPPENFGPASFMPSAKYECYKGNGSTYTDEDSWPPAETKYCRSCYGNVTTNCCSGLGREYCQASLALSGDRAVRPSTTDGTYPYKHYMSDYQTRFTVPTDTDSKEIFVDQYINPLQDYYGPEPFARYLRAINLSIDNLTERGSGADQAMLVSIRGDTYNPRRDAYPKDGSLTNNFRMLQQLTNIMNKGAVTNASPGTLASSHPVVSPNFIDIGFYPWGASDKELGYTNIIEPMYQVARKLDKCPASAQKVIVLATDGRHNCACPPWHWDPVAHECTTDDWSCNNSNWVFFRNANYRFTGLVAQDWPYPTLTEFLKEKGIMLTTLIDSQYVNPGFYNRKYDPDEPGVMKDRHESDPDNDDIFYTSLNDAYKAGHPIVEGWNPEKLIDTYCTGGCSQSYEAKDPSLSVGLVSMTFAHASIETGGVFCPLMVPCENGHSYADGKDGTMHTLNCTGENGSCYDADGMVRTEVRKFFHEMPGYWRPNQPQRCSPYAGTKYQQAFRCIMETFGLNPYILVEED